MVPRGRKQIAPRRPLCSTSSTMGERDSITEAMGGELDSEQGSRVGSLTSVRGPQSLFNHPPSRAHAWVEMNVIFGYGDLPAVAQRRCDGGRTDHADEKTTPLTPALIDP